MIPLPRALPLALLLAAGLAVAPPCLAQAPAGAAHELPEDHLTLARSTSYPELSSFLSGVDGKGPVSVSVATKTAGGRNVYLVRLSHGGEPRWKVFLYAQQHGDEVSGKDALLYLIRDVARDPGLLPRGVEVRIVPMVNPDGAEAGTRRNGSGADLNRDHMTLEHPETRALHRIAREFRPHVAVDGHEFTRDPEDWRKRGLVKWSDITMDFLCNPLFAPEVVAAARLRVDEAAEAESEAGHRFLRYWVGGVPPDEEQRHSAPDVDGGLNGIGMYGGLSFIIEAAVTRADGNESKDLGKRVDAYLVLFRRFLAQGPRPGELAAVEAARGRPLPAFLPANAFWANPAGAVVDFPVIDTATGKAAMVATPNLMSTMVVKGSVPTPAAYAIVPEAAGAFRELLSRHGIPFEEVLAARPVRAERCTLLRVEEEFDDLYGRYGGRQIVRREPAARVELAPGSLLVPLAGEAALRAALVLEPAQLYGLYQYPRYRALASWNGTLPVLRVVPGS